MRNERGAILLVVLAVLAMMSVLAASLSRSSMSRLLAAQEFRRMEEDARRKRDDLVGEREAMGHGGVDHDDRATIGGGAEGASTNEGHHGSQTIPPGGDDRLRRGTDGQGHR
jgi:hypothetical protein